MRRSRPRFPPWRQNRPQYQQAHRPQSSQYQHQQGQSSDFFDFLNFPESFPSMKQLIDDPILTPSIMERNQQLTPSPAQNFALINFVGRVRQKLEALVLSPNLFTACQVHEVRDVGSHKHSTLIVPPLGSPSHLAADLVVVLKTLPTREAIDQLGSRIKQELQNETLPNEAPLILSMQPTDYGLSLDNGSMAVHLLLTTLPANWYSLDPTIHLDRTVCKRNLNSIKHSKWVDEACVHPSNKVIVRLLKDLRQRFNGLEPLNPWLINLLAHHCVVNKNSGEQLPPSYAFKRALQLLSSGLFLPGSNGIYDPFHDMNMNQSRSSHALMTPEEQDRLCYTSQTLLRALAIHPKFVLGLENGPDIFAGPCQLNGVLFEPNEPVVLNDEQNGYSINHDQQQPAFVEVNS